LNKDKVGAIIPVSRESEGILKAPRRKGENQKLQKKIFDEKIIVKFFYTCPLFRAKKEAFYFSFLFLQIFFEIIFASCSQNGKIS